MSARRAPHPGGQGPSGNGVDQPVIAAAAVPAGDGIPREVELKYIVRDVDALRVWLAGGWGGALRDVRTVDERTVEVEDRYIDTAYRALEAAGFGARLRRKEGGPFRLNVKSASHARGANGERSTEGPAALSERMEVEGPASDRLDPDTWPASAARELVDRVRRGARLRAIFTLRQRREQRTLALEAGSVELTLDLVSVVRGGRPLASFTVLEVEALDGAIGSLPDLAALLEATGHVAPEPRSKEEIARAYVAEAADDTSLRIPPVPRSPGLRADDPLGLAGRRVLRMHLARMLAFEAGTRSGEEAEDLHKMRVATRRMRAAWRTFGDAYGRKVRRRYVRELRTVARALGDVRDLDVLIGDLEAYAEDLPAAGREAIEPLHAAWRRRREDARARLLDRLDSRAYRTFVDDYLAFTDTASVVVPPATKGEPTLVRDTAGSRILAAYERVTAYETVMAWADVTTLHALRVEGKRLRYALEAFEEVLPASAGGLIVTVTEMQDHLGAMNDAHVAAATTRGWLDTNAPALASTTREAVWLYLDAREADVERQRRSFGPVWRRVTGRAFRRALGAALTRIE